MHDQPIDNHSSVNEMLLNPSHYNAKASYTKEDYPYLHRKLARKNHSKNKAVTSEQEKTSNNTLDQTSYTSFHLRSSFINDMESLSITSDERHSKSTGEFYFANDPLSKQRIIDQLRREQTNLFCIRSLEDLEKHGLIQQIWLTDDGQLQHEEGRLFFDYPTTLIFDLTAMTSSEIASCNDILQVNPRCNDKPLGNYVRRVFLVNDAMLNGEQIANPDLWRRLGRMSQEEIPDADNVPDSITDDALLAKKTTEEIPVSKSHKIIDFSGSDEWYFLLFGGITMNGQGTFIFSEGALSHLGDDTHLVLKNAPWNSTGFKEAIAEALRTEGFEANGQWVDLPNNTTISRECVSTTELNNLKCQVLKDNAIFRSDEMFVCINSSSIENLQGSIRIEGNVVVMADMLATLLNGSRQLVITSELEENQWLWLFANLDTLPEGGKPSLFTHLPPALLLSSEAMRVKDVKDLSLLREENHPFIYEINPSDTLDSMQQVRLNSQNNFTFSLINSPLMECLIHGTPVILGGLECNSTLAASLETLLLPKPYLFIHGNKVDLPNASVTFIKPVIEQATSSPLINQVLSSIDSQRSSLSENPIYSLLKSLPSSCQKNYSKMLPWSPDTFEYQFDLQIKAEQQLDNSADLMPCHKRRAMHVLFAKAYRENSAIYSYIKAKIAQYYPDEFTDNRSDRSALQQWLTKYSISEITRQKIKEDFWALVRHCPVNVHEAINDLNKIDEVSLTKLATHLVGVAHKSWQATLAYQLEVDPTLAREQSFFDGVMRSTLRDALIANKALLKPGTVISKTVVLLEEKIVPVLARTQSNQQKLQEIKEILALYFQGDQLPNGYQDLPDALITNQRHTHARQQRRLARLADLIQLHPIVFLQGEAGAGKTFMAKAVANKAGYSGCKVIHIDPTQTADELFGGQQLKRYTVDNKTDQCSEFHQGPLLEWASSNDPELLLLDEANLASEGLLSPLDGLLRKCPELHYQGNKYPLTEKHRIIMTGNPEHYVGRHLDKAFQSRIPILFCPPLQDRVLADSIILPNLPNWPDVQKQQACDRIIILFNLFKELVPGDLVTPRDIKDVLATVHQILSYYPEQLENPTEEQINALIRRAFMDSLAGAVTEDYQQRLNSLNYWCQGQFPEDRSVMTNVDQAFDAFVKQLQKENTDADFSPAPIRQLVYHYWQHLDKGEGGRVAVLVEGSTGWGKDFILDKTIKLWQQQQALNLQPGKPFVHINANPSQWSFQVERVEEAKRDGKPIIISEFNLIPSHYQEGCLNDVLTTPIEQGFRLFATINPSSFEGREVLSPALKSRCTQIKLGALSQSDMNGMLQRLPNMPQGLSQWLAENFHQLSTALDDQKSAVRLTLDDLFSSAKDLASKNDDQWEEAFQQHLPLQFQALGRNIFLPRLKEERARCALKHAQEQYRLACEKAINSLPELLAPITVTFGELFRIDDRDITIKLDTTVEQVVSDIKSALQNRKINGDKMVKRRSATHIDDQDVTIKPDTKVEQVVRDVKPALQNHKVNDDDTVKRRSAATYVKRVRKGYLYVFRAINKIPHFNITCYFPKNTYSFDDYRLNLQTTCLDEDGKLRAYPIDWKNGGLFADVAGWPDSINWREDIRADELPGHIVLSLNDQWQSLPSLTAADQLRAIRCIPTTDIQLTRCQTTGLLLIKCQRSKSKKVTIDFIIAPEQRYFTQLKREDSLIVQENLCSQRLRRLLDVNIFDPSGDSCEAYKALRTIHQIDHIPQRLKALMDWLDTFSSDKNITGEGEDMFLNMLKQKRGVCSHKSCIFENLCHYWGLPARQVCNVGHVFVEVSPDGGDTWRQYQLGGGGQCTKTVADKHWDGYQPPLTSELSPPVHGAPFANSECNQEGAGASLITSAISRVGRFDSLRHGLGKMKVGLSQLFLNEGNGKKCNLDIDQIVNQRASVTDVIPSDSSTFIREIEKKLIESLPLSDARRCQFITCLELTLKKVRCIKYDKVLIIKILTYNIERFSITITNESTLPNEYFDYLCHLCEIDNEFKIGMIGYLQSNMSSHSLYRNRVQKMINGLPFFVNEMCVRTAINNESEMACFVRYLPNSNYLERKLAQVKIDRTYTRVPKANSHLSLGRMIAGLPSFFNQSKSTLKYNKPVIIDISYLRMAICQRIFDFCDFYLVENKSNLCIKMQIQGNNNVPNVYVDKINMLNAFIIWIAKHKPVDNSVWQWLANEYTTCYEQTSPIQVPIIPYMGSWQFPCVELPSEIIRVTMNESSAIILQHKELCAILNDFLNAISKCVIE